MRCDSDLGLHVVPLAWAPDICVCFRRGLRWFAAPIFRRRFRHCFASVAATFVVGVVALALGGCGVDRTGLDARAGFPTTRAIRLTATPRRRDERSRRRDRCRRSGGSIVGTGGAGGSAGAGGGVVVEGTGGAGGKLGTGGMIGAGGMIVGTGGMIGAGGMIVGSGGMTGAAASSAPAA